jgi:hypothetical protein
MEKENNLFIEVVRKVCIAHLKDYSLLDMMNSKHYPVDSSLLSKLYKHRYKDKMHSLWDILSELLCNVLHY